jgi:predicted phage baseplate assembly protein
MKFPEVCADQQRTRALPGGGLTGIDYVEVSDDQRTLKIYFLGRLPDSVTEKNIRIEGGVGIRNVKVQRVVVSSNEQDDTENHLNVMVDRPGDFSTYRLELVGVAGVDPYYAGIDFTFKVNCPSDLDCRPDTPQPFDERRDQEINYLAKDYASFRQLILDRLAALIPEWKERHVPDLGMVLAEVMAYVGDYLSYYQDAVATEAYLNTARQRISVRRHARLIDYQMHEGCNARTWITVRADQDTDEMNLQDFYFITGDHRDGQRVLTEWDLSHLPQNYEVFEPMLLNRPSVTFYKAHSEIRFYTWGNTHCHVPKGTTEATLEGYLVDDPQKQSPGGGEGQPTSPIDLGNQQGLHLRVGDVLIFEERISPLTGREQDADLEHRHAVHLTALKRDEDPLFQKPLTHIEWAHEDALPFDLTLSTKGPGGEYLEHVSVARGNVILADHGRRVELEELGTVAPEPSETPLSPRRFNPRLEQRPLTFSEPISSGGSAVALLRQNSRKEVPQILNLRSGTRPANTALPDEVRWSDGGGT